MSIDKIPTGKRVEYLISAYGLMPHMGDLED